MSSFVRFIGSRRLTAFLLLVWLLLLLVWVVPFHLYGLPEQQVRSIVYRVPFFQALYMLVALNTVGCIASHAVTVITRARWVPASGGTHPRIGSSVPSHVASSVEPKYIQATLASRRFKHMVVGDGWVWAVKNRWSPLGTVVFHAGLIVLLCGVSVGVLMPGLRFQGDLVLAEGESFAGVADAFIDVSGDPSATPPVLSFTVHSINPRFYKDMLLFTALEAEVQAHGRSHVVSVSRPWLPRPDTSVSLSDFGYAIEVISQATEGGSPVRRVYKLKAFPSGQRDSIEVPVGEDRYRVYVQVYGDYIDRDGRPGVKSFNSDDPRLVVSVARILEGGSGERVMADEVLLPIGGRVEVPGAALQFPGLRHYGVFRVVRDPIAPVVFTALVLTLGGVVIRLVFPRTEAVLVTEGSTTMVAVRSDFYGARPRQAECIARRLEGAWL